MDSTRILIEQLQAEIAADLAALEEKRRVVSFLQRRAAQESARAAFGDDQSPGGSWSRATHVRTGLPSVAVDLNTASFLSSVQNDGLKDREAYLARPSLAKLVLLSVESFGDREFSVSDIIDEIRASTGREITQRALVSTAMARLVDRKVVTLVEIGKGSAPNRYRRTAAETDASPEGEGPTERLEGAGDVDLA